MTHFDHRDLNHEIFHFIDHTVVSAAHAVQAYLARELLAALRSWVTRQRGDTIHQTAEIRLVTDHLQLSGGAGLDDYTVFRQLGSKLAAFLELNDQVGEINSRLLSPVSMRLHIVSILGQRCTDSAVNQIRNGQSGHSRLHAQGTMQLAIEIDRSAGGGCCRLHVRILTSKRFDVICLI